MEKKDKRMGKTGKKTGRRRTSEWERQGEEGRESEKDREKKDE